MKRRSRTTLHSISTTASGRARSIAAGPGPAVIVIHEMPGLHPLVMRFADSRGGRGHDGVPARACSASRGASDDGLRSSRRCCEASASAASSPSGPPTARARSSIGCARWRVRSHAECGGRGVGAVGMCFTGRLRPGDDDRAGGGRAGAVAAVVAAADRLEEARRGDRTYRRRKSSARSGVSRKRIYR